MSIHLIVYLIINIKKIFTKKLGNMKTFYYLYYVINDKIRYEKLQ